MYFYADRTDRNGNRLITSYGKQEQAKKYGGATAKISQGEKRMTIRADGSANLSNDGGDLLVRTVMVREGGNAGTDPNGKFVVYGRVNGKWSPTDFRYKTYAAANSAVKSALITMFEACAVIELEGDEQLSAPASEAETEESAPFDL